MSASVFDKAHRIAVRQFSDHTHTHPRFHVCIAIAAAFTVFLLALFVTVISGLSRKVYYILFSLCAVNTSFLGGGLHVNAKENTSAL